MTWSWVVLCVGLGLVCIGALLAAACAVVGWIALAVLA